MGDEAFALEISPAETTGGIVLRLRRLARLLRLTCEICAAVAIIAWLFARVPFAVRAFGEILRRASTVIVSPSFVFLLGNAIVGALLSRFRRDPPSSALENGGLLYEELRYQIAGESTPSPEPAAGDVVAVDEIVFQDKEMIVCERRITSSEEESCNSVVERAVFFDAASTDSKQASYRRSRSEIKVLEKVSEKGEEDGNSTGEKLRRSKSADECRKGSGFSSSGCNTGEGGGKGEEEGGEDGIVNEDGLSSDEFRRTIENFIAKQLRFHRQESMSVVLESQA